MIGISEVATAPEKIRATEKWFSCLRRIHRRRLRNARVRNSRQRHGNDCNFSLIFKTLFKAPSYSVDAVKSTVPEADYVWDDYINVGFLARAFNLLLGDENAGDVALHCLGCERR
uniref:Uncharacterized protein n=1 Tax=Cucumis sativus TaxID=3659 RepID=A0A0A0LWY5_CUCSA